MKRRRDHQAMQPVADWTWCVVRDEIGYPLKIEMLPPGTDPNMVMIRMQSRSIRLGFEPEEPPGRFPIYFCRRGEQRRQVSIERVNPVERPRGHSSGSYAAPEPPAPPTNVTPIRRSTS